jgi:putative phosphotransacetylase
VGCKGTSSFCQECGACGAGAGTNSYNRAHVDAPAAASGNSIVDIIAQEVTRTIRAEAGLPAGTSGMPTIPLGVSNHHLHVTRDTFEQLFGVGTEFEVYRDLPQPGEFASKHTVTILGPKMRPIQNIRILGALRDYDQVEVSLTDAITLGIRPPIGDLANGAPLTIVGPKGSVHREHIAVIANRHVHMSDVDAGRFGIKDGDYCKVRIPGEKGTIFENVLVRTDPSWNLFLHLDTDDANAAHVRCDTQVEFCGKM